MWLSLSNFIREHHVTIVDAFEGFARTMMPPGANMVASQLRDHAEEMLSALVEDMDAPQSEDEQSRKSPPTFSPMQFSTATTVS